METGLPPLAPVKSALFVDFDNIYIGLSKTDPLAAERFASDPARWLAWLEQGLPAIPGETSPGSQRRRSILIRRCYPNPDAGFRRYRSFFTSSAFSVIDCPSLTRTGKNSSDIYMVMDILDILNHKTHFDEFIIFSGDSDFMPVLLRLRAYDRRTTTLAVDFMPPAFKAACDLVISEEDLIEDALGIPQENGGGNGVIRARMELPVLKEMAQRVLEVVRQQGEVVGADLPDILKDFREFRESSNWLGFGTSQRLAEALVHHEPQLSVIRMNPVQYKLSAVASHRIGGDLNPAVAPQVEPTVNEQEPDHELRRQIVMAVHEVVRAADSAVLLARASQYVVNKIGPRVLESQWAGTGSFKKLLLGIHDLGLEITSQPEPGYIYDPARHEHPAQRGARGAHREVAAGVVASGLPGSRRAYPVEGARSYDQEDEPAGFAEPLPTLDEFARRVSQVTGAPLLTQEQYAAVFRGMYHEMQEIAEGRKTYNTYQTAKSVSDWCAEQGYPVSHGDIVQIFKGIIFQDGIRFSQHPGDYTPLNLAQVVRDNIQALCLRSRMELSRGDCSMLDAWISGALDDGFTGTIPQVEV